MGESRRIEWPPRSGVSAEYEPHEERFLRELAAACEAGALDEAQLVREVEVVHGLKALLGARILTDAEASRLDPARYGEAEVFEFPSPDSPFQLPPRAVEALAAHDPQMRIA